MTAMKKTSKIHPTTTGTFSEMIEPKYFRFFFSFGQPALRFQVSFGIFPKLAQCSLRLRKINSRISKATRDRPHLLSCPSCTAAQLPDHWGDQAQENWDPPQMLGLIRSPAKARLGTKARKCSLFSSRCSYLLSCCALATPRESVLCISEQNSLFFLHHESLRTFAHSLAKKRKRAQHVCKGFCLWAFPTQIDLLIAFQKDVYIYMKSAKSRLFEQSGDSACYSNHDFMSCLFAKSRTSKNVSKWVQTWKWCINSSGR